MIKWNAKRYSDITHMASSPLPRVDSLLGVPNTKLAHFSVIKDLPTAELRGEGRATTSEPRRNVWTPFTEEKVVGQD